MLRLFSAKSRLTRLLAGALASACNVSAPPATTPSVTSPGVTHTVAPSAASPSAASPSATPAAPSATPAAPSAAPATPSVAPTKVELHEKAMGTSVTFVAYTSPRADEAAVRAAMARALAEMLRLEALMSEWQDTSEIGQVNAHAGSFVHVSPETLEVIQKGLWAGKLSGGAFDITFQAMSGLWKFGGAAEATPKLPTPAAVRAAKLLVDYRKVELQAAEQNVRIAPRQQLGLGGIAKGYIVDRAASILRAAGLDSFLVQAGGDLYGAGHKPDGTRWVSGIRDPRGPQEQYFATLELEDHAFSTAGDYARSYVVGGKRYHHIIDPRTGYPATACRSVTVWAPDAFLADAVDDIVFILGPEKGLPLVEALDGVGVVVVDSNNRLSVSPRLAGKVHLLSQPTDGL